MDCIMLPLLVIHNVSTVCCTTELTPHFVVTMDRLHWTSPESKERVKPSVKLVSIYVTDRFATQPVSKPTGLL